MFSIAVSRTAKPTNHLWSFSVLALPSEPKIPRCASSAQPSARNLLLQKCVTFRSLRLYSKRSLAFLTIYMRRCTAKSSSIRCIFPLSPLLVLALAGSTPAQTPPGASVSASQNPASGQIPPPAVPPKSLPEHIWNIVGSQEVDGSIRRVHREEGHQA